MDIWLDEGRFSDLLLRIKLAPLSNPVGYYIRVI